MKTEDIPFAIHKKGWNDKREIITKCEFCDSKCRTYSGVEEIPICPFCGERVVNERKVSFFLE